jgi:CDP-diacylglycerol--glycerol-3-phosphate 3-phosphatidyltransferase
MTSTKPERTSEDAQSGPEGPRSFLPTLLTVFRIAMGPAIAGLVLVASTQLYADRLLAGFIYALCFILFVLAAFSDWLDGWLARKLNAVSPLGAALDHVADKVLIACCLIALAYAALPLSLVAAAIVILGRDIAIAGLREALALQGREMPVGELGKWKAAAEMAGVGAMFAHQAAALLFASPALIVGLSWGAQILLWTAAGLALLSAAQYLAALRRSDRPRP